MADDAVSDVLMYTQDMMLAVIDNRWDDLLKMQSTQDKMLKKLFAVADAIFSEQQRADLLEVQCLNQKIVAAAALHRTDIAGELRKMRQGKLKAGNYLAS